MERSRLRYYQLATLLLLLFNLVLLGSLYFRGRAVKRAVEESIVVEPGSTPINPTVMGERLNFSGAQLEEYIISSRNFRREANQIVRELSFSKGELNRALYRAAPDSVAAYETSKNIGELHRELKEITVKFYLQLHNLCDEEQRGELQLLFEPLFKDTPPLRGGYGGGRGRGRGAGAGGAGAGTGAAGADAGDKK